MSDIFQLWRRPNCTFFADSYTGIALAGPQVASWTSRVPGVPTPFSTGSGALQPIYVTNAFRGKPGVFFDGVDDRLSGPNSNTLVDPSAHTMFCVFIPIVDPGSVRGVFTNVTRSVGFNTKTGPFRISAYGFDGVSKTIDFNITAGNAYIVTSRHDGTNLYASLNGAAEQSTPCGAMTDLVQIHRIGMGSTSSPVTVAMCATFNRFMPTDELYYCISEEKLKWCIS